MLSLNMLQRNAYLGLVSARYLLCAGHDQECEVDVTGEQEGIPQEHETIAGRCLRGRLGSQISLCLGASSPRRQQGSDTTTTTHEAQFRVRFLSDEDTVFCDAR